MLDEMELLSTCCGAGGLGNIHEFQDEHYGLCGKCKDHADFKYEEMWNERRTDVKKWT